MLPLAGQWYPVWSKKKDCRIELIWYLNIQDKVPDSLEYGYIVQIADGCTSHVFKLLSTCNHQIRKNIWSCFARWRQTHDLCVSFLFAQYSYIPICNTKHHIYKTEYAPFHHSRTYTNVYIKYKVHVYIEVIWIIQLTYMPGKLSR